MISAKDVQPAAGVLKFDDAAADIGNTAQNIAGDIGNDVQKTGDKIENKVGNTDVNVKVDKDVHTNAADNKTK